MFVLNDNVFHNYNISLFKHENLKMPFFEINYMEKNLYLKNVNFYLGNQQVLAAYFFIYSLE